MDEKFLLRGVQLLDSGLTDAQLIQLPLANRNSIWLATIIAECLLSFLRGQCKARDLFCGLR